MPSSDPKRFVLTSVTGASAVVEAAHPQVAYEALDAFVESHKADSYTIRDEKTGDSLDLLPERCIVVRHDVCAARTDFLKVKRPRQCLTAAMLFFESGPQGLSHFGVWVSDLVELEATPEEEGARRAARITTEQQAREELLRLWADHGCVDPSDRFYVFLESRRADEAQADRIVVLALLRMLGLTQVDRPEGARDGEVWVLRDARIDAELEQWS